VPADQPDLSADAPPDLPAAVLWDLDGTLVDTEPSWMAAEYALADRHGATWTHADALTLVGNDLRTSGRLLVEGMGLSVSVDEVVDELVAAVVASIERELVVRPGARELLTALHDAGVPCGLVTMSYAPIACSVVTALGADLFAAVVTGDSVRHGKPHPEPYLTAAAMLGLDPADCTAIEDSPPGAASAHAAGCQVVVVPNMVEVIAQPGWTVMDTLAGISVHDLPARQSQRTAERQSERKVEVE
jgi:HAD superfamily hydrolase (TIGR01509 family)